MRLPEYLDDVGIPLSAFARKCGFTKNTLYNVINQKGEILLSTALRIEAATRGQVTCKELVPEEFLEVLSQIYSNKNSKHSQKKKVDADDDAKI